MARIEDAKILFDVPVQVSAILECSAMTMEEILALAPGSLVKTPFAAGDNISLCVQQVPIASAEVLVIGAQLACRITKFRERK